MCFSTSPSWSSRRAASKIPPQFRRASAQLVVAPLQIIESNGGQRELQNDDELTNRPLSRIDESIVAFAASTVGHPSIRQFVNSSIRQSVNSSIRQFVNSSSVIFFLP
jgi:hypothetical protein